VKLNWIEADLVDQLVGIGLYGLHRQDVIVRILDERLSMLLDRKTVEPNE